MSKQKRVRVGRLSIDSLKVEYRRGVNKFGVTEARTHLLNSGIDKKHLTHSNLSDWMRQAGLELAEFEKRSVTNRVRVNEYETSSVPTLEQRQKARKSRRTDTRTRVMNDVIEAKADVTRDDASAEEKALVLVYESVVAALGAIEQLS